MVSPRSGRAGWNPRSLACTLHMARLATSPALNKITVVFDEVVMGEALEAGNGGLLIARGSRFK